MIVKLRQWIWRQGLASFKTITEEFDGYFARREEWESIPSIFEISAELMRSNHKHWPVDPSLIVVWYCYDTDTHVVVPNTWNGIVMSAFVWLAFVCDTIYKRLVVSVGPWVWAQFNLKLVLKDIHFPFVIRGEGEWRKICSGCGGELIDLCDPALEVGHHTHECPREFGGNIRVVRARDIEVDNNTMLRPVGLVDEPVVYAVTYAKTLIVVSEAYNRNLFPFSTISEPASLDLSDDPHTSFHNEHTLPR